MMDRDYIFKVGDRVMRANSSDTECGRVIELVNPYPMVTVQWKGFRGRYNNTELKLVGNGLDRVLDEI